MMRLAVCGHANVDVHLQVQDLPKPGQSTPVLERRTARGGTGANIARHAGSLGLPVRLWARVGGDFPSSWRRDLEFDGVDLSHMEVVAGARTPTCFVLTDTLDRQSFCMDQGAMDGMADSPPPHAMLDLMGAGDWLHVATGDPLAYAGIAEAARRQGVSVALDPGQEFRFRYDAKSFAGLLSLADIFFCNEEELRVACSFLGLNAPEALLDKVPALVVTRGAKGASLYERSQEVVHVPAIAAPRVVNPTGAGDVLRAGWYAALKAGKARGEALRWGAAAASISIQHEGPQSHPVQLAELAAALKS
jgi:sugar/nucleoside kinase (ribokinase family)